MCKDGVSWAPQDRKELISISYDELKAKQETLSVKKQNLDKFAKITFHDIKKITRSCPSYYLVEKNFILRFLTRDHFDEEGLDEKLNKDTTFLEDIYSGMEDLNSIIAKYKEEVLESICEGSIFGILLKRINNKNDKIKNVRAYIKKTIDGILKQEFDQERWFARDYQGHYDDLKTIKAIRRLRKDIKEIEEWETLEKQRGRKGLTDIKQKKLENLKSGLNLIFDITRPPGKKIGDKEKMNEKELSKIMKTDPTYHSSEDLDSSKGISHLLTPEEILLRKEKSKEIAAAESESLNAKEKEILRLHFEEELSQPEIAFLVDPPNRKNIPFNMLVDINYLKNRLRRCHSKQSEIIHNFENRILSYMSQDIRKILKLKTIYMNDEQEKKLLDFFEKCFYDRSCFSDDELKKVRLHKGVINNLFKRQFENLSKDQIFRLNLLALYRVYPKKYEKDIFRGFLSVARIKQIIDKGSEKLMNYYINKDLNLEG